MPDIAHLLDCSREYVRGVIRAFNDIGFRALEPRWSGGRPRTISEIRLIARCCPRDLGLPHCAGSLGKLAGYVAATGVVAGGQPGNHQADPADRNIDALLPPVRVADQNTVMGSVPAPGETPRRSVRNSRRYRCKGSPDSVVPTLPSANRRDRRPR